MTSYTESLLLLNHSDSIILLLSFLRICHILYVILFYFLRIYHILFLFYKYRNLFRINR
ncbi:hypothetical protein Hanom_Chr13g01244671 [Helianthus anomalus]